MFSSSYFHEIFVFLSDSNKRTHTKPTRCRSRNTLDCGLRLGKDRKRMKIAFIEQNQSLLPVSVCYWVSASVVRKIRFWLFADCDVHIINSSDTILAWKSTTLCRQTIPPTSYGFDRNDTNCHSMRYFLKCPCFGHLSLLLLSLPQLTEWPQFRLLAENIHC